MYRRSLGAPCFSVVIRADRSRFQQVATNDTDVDFVEAEMLIHALKVKKPQLAELVVYQNPEHGHYLNRQVDLKTLTRKDDPVQKDSWDRIWRFLRWHLRP